jgi:hypothetical protein
MTEVVLAELESLLPIDAILDLIEAAWSDFMKSFSRSQRGTASRNDWNPRGLKAR